MRLALAGFAAVLACCGSLAHAKSWSFQDATVSIQRKGSGSASTQEKLTASNPLSQPLTLGSLETLKITITTIEDQKATRPNQAFLNLREASTGLEDSFPFNVRETGSGKVDLSQKDLPTQLLTSEQPLKASIVIASFGSSTPINVHVFDLNVNRDQSSPVRVPEEITRYGKLDEIHHIFRADPKSPPKVITLFFTVAAVATIPLLIGVWLSLGSNLNHASEAFGNAPFSHALFLGSILALEGIFFLYYRSLTLFQMLPAAGFAGSVAFVSGSRALSEVQGRRLAGKR